MSKYDVSGKYGGTKSNGSTPRLPAPEPEILPPSSQTNWKPRAAHDIAVEDPVLKTVKPLFGPAYVDTAGYRAELYDAKQTNEAATALLQAKEKREQALQSYERTLAQRELLPGLIERDRIAIGIDITLAQGELAKARQVLANYDRAVSDAARLGQLDSVEYELALARKQTELAEAKAKQARAEKIAGLRAQAEEMSAQQVLYEAQCGRDEAEGRAARAQRTRGGQANGFGDDNDPPEFREAMEVEEKRQRIARASAKREQAILARVNGDESQLTEDEVEMLEGIRQAKARAQRQFDGAAALGAIFPYAESEEE